MPCPITDLFLARIAVVIQTQGIGFFAHTATRHLALLVALAVFAVFALVLAVAFVPAPLAYVPAFVPAFRAFARTCVSDIRLLTTDSVLLSRSASWLLLRTVTLPHPGVPLGFFRWFCEIISNMSAYT
jgi:hypothetical protein